MREATQSRRVKTVDGFPIIARAILVGVFILAACPGSKTPTPPWNYVFYQADDNGFPLNPPWGYQIAAPFTEPSCGYRNESPTSQHPWKNGGNMCADGAHYNFTVATYEGLVCWDSHSGDDDDYNINLYRPDNAGFQPKSQNIGTEFDSDETIDYFSTRWWSDFHNAVDDSDTKAGALINGKEAIVIGTLGLDAPHGHHPEIHPVMAIAIHAKSDPADDTWAVFVRNWGDEGYCGDEIEEVAQRDFTFRLPWRKGADEVTDGGTHLLARLAGDTFSITPLRVQNAVLVTITIAPFFQRDRVHGEVHLVWHGPSVETNPSPWAWTSLWRS